MIIVFLISLPMYCYSLLGGDSTNAVFLYKEETAFYKVFYNDTTLSFFHQYKPVYKGFFLYNGIGLSPIYSLSNFNIIEPFWFSSISQYIADAYNTYCKTYKPYTSISFISNTTKLYNEEFLKAIHSQNINPFINLYFEGLTSQHKGMIPHQESRMHYLYGSTNINLPLLKLNAFYIYSLNKTKESGGVSNTTEIVDSLFPLQNSIPFLTRALNKLQGHNSRIKSFVFFKKDTLQLKPRLSLHFEYATNYFRKIYTDVPSTYYLNFFNDSTKTYDSLYYDNSTYKIGPSFIKKNVKAAINFVIKNTRWFNNAYKYNVEANGLGFFYDYSYSNLTLLTEMLYFFDGYYSNNYSGSLKLLKQYRKFNINLVSSILCKEPDMFYEQIFLNNFQWCNVLDKQYYYNVNVALTDSSKENSISLFYHYFKNFYYLNEHYNINAHNFYNIGLQLSKLFAFNNFYLYLKAITQTNNTKAIETPLLVTYSALYYQNKSFNKTLTFQIGIDVYYFTKFYSPQYVPALSTFIYKKQNSGSYPLLSFFVNFSLKRAKFFILVEHLNYGITHGNFCLIPNYPLPPRNFKFGINWRFYD
ncbi:MAG: putative porin [Bacteroidales bacterium]|nr:putative porin [Bacteroidales bacterium]